MPKGLKPVRRTLATGETRLYWYHRATGRRLKADPATAEGMLEVQRLDGKAQALQTAQEAAQGSLAALWEVYRLSPEWRSLKPRTRSDYQAVRDWLGDAADRAILNSITSAQVIGLRDWAFKAKGRRFANYVVQVLRMLFGWGKLRNKMLANPATGVPAIRKPIGASEANRSWSATEIRAFTASAPPQIVVPFVLGLFAGMRQGDALIATWSAYDGATLRWIAGKNGELVIAPVTGIFKTILDAAKKRRGSSLQIATTAAGDTWTQSGFRSTFFKHVRKLTKAGHLQPGCTFHGLRHTLATGARDAGESDSRVAAAIGDRSPAMAQIYGRGADRAGAQTSILGATQKRFENIEWKTPPADRKMPGRNAGAKTPKKPIK